MSATMPACSQWAVALLLLWSLASGVRPVAEDRQDAPAAAAVLAELRSSAPSPSPVPSSLAEVSGGAMLATINPSPSPPPGDPVHDPAVVPETGVRTDPEELDPVDIDTLADKGPDEVVDDTVGRAKPDADALQQSTSGDGPVITQSQKVDTLAQELQEKAAAWREASGQIVEKNNQMLTAANGLHGELEKDGKKMNDVVLQAGPDAEITAVSAQTREEIDEQNNEEFLPGTKDVRLPALDSGGPPHDVGSINVEERTVDERFDEAFQKSGLDPGMKDTVAAQKEKFLKLTEEERSALTPETVAEKLEEAGGVEDDHVAHGVPAEVTFDEAAYTEKLAGVEDEVAKTKIGEKEWRKKKFMSDEFTDEQRKTLTAAQIDAWEEPAV